MNYIGFSSTVLWICDSIDLFDRFPVQFLSNCHQQMKSHSNAQTNFIITQSTWTYGTDFRGKISFWNELCGLLFMIFARSLTAFLMKIRWTFQLCSINLLTLQFNFCCGVKRMVEKCAKTWELGRLQTTAAHTQPQWQRSEQRRKERTRISVNGSWKLCQRNQQTSEIKMVKLEIHHTHTLQRNSTQLNSFQLNWIEN